MVSMVKQRRRIPKPSQSSNMAQGATLQTFKEAIFKVALKEYGGLGKLIKQDPYGIPSIPNKATYGSLDPAVDIDGINQTMYPEYMKGIPQEDQGDGR
jgi:hypothetical protein